MFGGSLEEKTIKLNFSSNLENLPIASQKIKDACSLVVKDEWLLYQLELCAVEVISNIIKHAYELKENQPIEMVIRVSPKEVTLIFYDVGKSVDYFHPLELEDTLKNFDEAESGRGLSIINNFMDIVKISKEEGRNVTELKKNLGDS